MLSRVRRRLLVCAFILFVICALLVPFAGKLLIVDQPQHSDIIVVLCGDIGDVRFLHALKLLRSGYAQDLVLDAPDWTEYGQKDSDLARQYIQAIAPDQASHLHVCSFKGDSTQLELREISPCLHTIAPHATTALLVTSSFHTRRAFSVAKSILPQYTWSVGAASDPRFGAAWWHHREWAKMMLTEWQKLGWWSMVEQWLARPGPNQ